MGLGVGAGTIFIAQPHPMLKQSRINDKDYSYSTSHDIKMFFD
jgi:hypothetical protein